MEGQRSKQTVARDTVREASEAGYPGAAVVPSSALPGDLDQVRADFEKEFVRAGISALELQLLDRLLYAPELPLILEDSPRPEASLDRLLRALSSWLMDQISIRGGATQAQVDRLASKTGARSNMQQRLLDIIDEAQRADAALPPGVKQSEGGEPVARPGAAKKRTGKPA